MNESVVLEEAELRQASRRTRHCDKQTLCVSSRWSPSRHTHNLDLISQKTN